MPPEAGGERTTLHRYEEIVRSLLEDVDRGVYALGDRLPTEIDLCEKFHVSRHTAREALRRLQQMGYVSRRQGSGSVLVSQRPDGLFHNSINSLEEVLQYATTTRVHVLSVDRIVAEPELARRLGCMPNSQWFRVNAMRRADGADQPLAYTEIFVDVAFADIVQNIGVVQTAVYRMIEQAHGLRIVEVTQEIAAVTADANIASRLVIAPGSAVLLVQRRYFAEGGRLVEIAVNAHPGTHFRYEMSLQRR